jgi:hypothetical protein
MRSTIFKSNRPMPPKPSAREPKPCGRRRLSSAAACFINMLLLLLVLPAAADAYTLVMRSGRHVEIPDTFVVTRTTLTYEAGPGINVTLQLNTIDITATERLNKEAYGSLLRRVGEPQGRASAQGNSPAATPPAASTSTPRARRTITNRDLEGARLQREQSEEAYERRRVELGLPSLEEARRRSEEEAARLRERSRRSEDEEALAETYWRTRAAELRTEFAVVDAQLNYIRNRLGQLRRPLFTGSYTVLAGAAPFFSFRPPRFPANVFARPSNGFGAVGVGAQAVAVTGFGGGTTRGRVIANPPIHATRAFNRRPLFSTPRLFGPSLGLSAISFPVYDTSYDRTLLFARLQELESVRAGLEARWRLLEDEARRAGAQPGWLRP